MPFELGRPFGPPGDPAFQKRVLLAALRLLERDDGPVLIEDFPDDDPRARPDPAWRPPLPRAAANGPPQCWRSAWRPRSLRCGRRTRAGWRGTAARTVGLSGLSNRRDAAAMSPTGCAARRRRARATAISAPLLLRFAVDDLKAYYLEAAAGTGGKPSSRQLGDWFWNDTAAGAGHPCAARDVPGAATTTG